MRIEDADAVMTGKGEDRRGAGSKATGGFLGIKDSVVGAVVIKDVHGTRELWASEAGDSTPVIGIVKRGPRIVAERLVSNLKKAIEAR